MAGSRDPVSDMASPGPEMTGPGQEKSASVSEIGLPSIGCLSSRTDEPDTRPITVDWRLCTFAPVHWPETGIGEITPQKSANRSCAAAWRSSSTERNGRFSSRWITSEWPVARSGYPPRRFLAPAALLRLNSMTNWRTATQRAYTSSLNERSASLAPRRRSASSRPSATTR